MNDITSEIFDFPSCKLRWLASQGFNIPNFVEFDSDELLENTYSEYVSEKRENLQYDIDGLVEEIDDFELQKHFGYEPNGVNPKFATAIKFDSVSKITKLIDIEFSVGMTGRLTPVAILEPIDIMGTTVSKATLHNIEHLENMIKKGLRKQTEVIVVRSGDVIPQILDVVKK